MLKRILLVGITLVLVFSSYKLWKVYQFNQLATDTRGQELSALPIKGTFSLTDHNGNAVTEATYKGRHTMVFFGYTYCPDVCPTALLDIGTVMDNLGDKAKNIVPLFVTVDPKRDTVEVMRDYLENFHPSIVGLTGNTDEINEASKSFRAYFGKVIMDASDPDGYMMSHSARIYLMGPDAKPILNFKHGESVENITKKIQEVL